MKRAAVLALMGTVILTGCGSNTNTATTNIETEVTDETATTSEAAASGSATGYTTEGIDVDLVGDYSDKAIEAAWSLEDATVISLSDTSVTISGDGATESDGVITISAKGTYVFTGEIAEGQIVVDVEDENVQLVLNNASITNSTDAPINVMNAKNVYLTLADGTENSIVDLREAAAETEETEEPDETAAIFSKTDLIINGTGTITVQANYNDGITSKDDLQIIDGVFYITAIDDGIVGKDSVSIRDGELNITAGGDGIKNSNEEDESKGYVVIDGGTINIEAGSDGIDSVYALVINGGDILVSESKEGFECLNIVINDGTVDITSSDDGINISDGSSTEGDLGGKGNRPSGGRGQVPGDGTTFNKGEAPEDGTTFDKGQAPADRSAFTEGEAPADMQDREAFADRKQDDRGGMGGGMVAAIDGALVINGGTITVNASGDGLDSNGDIQINGGTTIVYGPTDSNNGSLDYNGICEINGGVLLMTGSMGMEQEGSSESTQNMASVSFEKQQDAGTTVEIQDADGNVLYTITSPKVFQYAAVSAPECNTLESITFVTGSDSQSVNLNP